MAFTKTLEYLETRQSLFILKTERVKGVGPKRFKNGKYWNYYVRIYLDIDQEATNQNAYQLTDVSFVRYQLHSSYKQPIRIAENKDNNFELLVWTYGFYQFKATIFLKLGSPITLPGNVTFSISDEDREITSEDNEQLKVNL